MITPKHLGTFTLASDQIPTEEGWYYWVNDVLCTDGKFVKVVKADGFFGQPNEFYYECQREWVNVKTFRRSKWSQKLTFDLSIW